MVCRTLKFSSNLSQSEPDIKKELTFLWAQKLMPLMEIYYQNKSSYVNIKEEQYWLPKWSYPE